MCFGPKSFIVVSDPVVAKHVLRDNAKNYDKGQLAVVLEDIMGKGLIPADPETWRERPRHSPHKLLNPRCTQRREQAYAM
eukprot:1572109-Pleurochrysis_carterae.AAC.1